MERSEPATNRGTIAGRSVYEELPLRDIFGLTRVNLGRQMRAIHVPGLGCRLQQHPMAGGLALTETMVYLGFLLPRLQAVTDCSWRGAPIVVFFWSTQHLVIPFIPDGTHLISQLLGAFWSPQV